MSLALDYIHANLCFPLTLREICIASKVSLRTLHRMFMLCTGLSPKHYVLRCKLNAIRSELASASCSEVTVSAVASKYGISNLGRFSASYRGIFEEYPLDTLRRQKSCSAIGRAV